MTYLALKNPIVLLEHGIDEGVLTDTRRTDDDNRLSLEWRGVERTEVFLGEDEDVVLSTEKNQRLPNARSRHAMGYRQSR